MDSSLEGEILFGCFAVLENYFDYLRFSSSKSTQVKVGPSDLCPCFPSGSYGMSRNNVSVARFYDLSDDRQGTASASHIYREMAGPAGGPLSLSEIATKKADGVKMSMSKTTARVTPGRMFLRDKGMLTKGEREIIKGICKNRGDLRRDGCSQSDMTVRHHHEAWQMGKAMTASKDLLRGTLLEMASSGVAGGEAVSVKSLTQIKPKLVEKVTSLIVLNV
ncbi:uncharacterized protein LOC112565691 [Pomacea canaliculata]|uniref:uncharacterized protein LOC112565691 n=1 Tax=Pomacea canaliculata TaxID=400727 RepID=UPI000D737F10|nr:uncharacterized protein LOC112565691 [Pomacea canaliculata]